MSAANARAVRLDTAARIVMGCTMRFMPHWSAPTDSVPPAKVPEAIGFARIIENWQAPTIAGVQTGLTNVRTEGYNRVVEHVGASPSVSAIPTTNVAACGGTVLANRASHAQWH